MLLEVVVVQCSETKMSAIKLLLAELIILSLAFSFVANNFALINLWLTESAAWIFHLYSVSFTVITSVVWVSLTISAEVLFAFVASYSEFSIMLCSFFWYYLSLPIFDVVVDLFFTNLNSWTTLAENNWIVIGKGFLNLCKLDLFVHFTTIYVFNFRFH